jgi:acetyl esterase/lipase
MRRIDPVERRGLVVMSEFHPDLAWARLIPKIPITSRLFRLVPARPPAAAPMPDGLMSEDFVVPGVDDLHPVSVRVYRPKSLESGRPALFWMNGGGFVGGTLEQDEQGSIAFARELDITVVAVRYRVAPEHPSLAALEDAYAGLLWLFGVAAERGIDATRIAIGGSSAGGGLAATLAIYAHDRDEVRPVFQLLRYPMLDDRTATKRAKDLPNARVWLPKDNRYGWTSYLGVAPGSPGVSAYAVASRREDLSGLPSAWLGVGTLDLFCDEGIEYARRLNEAGVPCSLHVVPGAFHGFDQLFSKTDVARQFWAAQVSALRDVFA